MPRAARYLPLVVALLAACQTTAVSTSRDKYLITWSLRLDQYRAQFVEKDAGIRAKASQSVFAGLAQDSNPWPRIVSRVSELGLDIREAFVIAGRGEALKAFLTHIQMNPTPGLTDVWFVQQAQDLEREARQLDAKGQQFVKTFDQRLREGPDWVLEMENLAKSQGMLSGKDSELQSLHKQALSYFLDLRQAQAQDRYRAEQQARAAQTLFAMSAYLNQLNYQQQLLNALNRPRTCTVAANIVTCY